MVCIYNSRGRVSIPSLTMWVTEKGEEIYMSYGSHSNDFLLVECQFPSVPFKSHVIKIHIYIDGFYLDNNPSDGVYLDDIILKDLTPSEKEELAGQDCIG